ncbi:MAG: hypothetical protein LBT02_00995, partial [Rickettsiales bacterium]|nr:hypothetical protein [Rickettsiales bacterium]
NLCRSGDEKLEITYTHPIKYIKRNKRENLLLLSLSLSLSLWAGEVKFNKFHNNNNKFHNNNWFITL